MKRTEVEKFFQLLSFVVGSSDNYPKDISNKEWHIIYKLSCIHSLQGIILWKLQKTVLKPPFDLLMHWIAECGIIKSGNIQSNQVVVKVSRMFESKGFDSCILKGQGNTINYPDSLVRTCGDIDIWLDGGREKIMKIIEEEWPGQLVRYHHVEIPPVDGIPVEVHFFPSYMHAPWRNKKLQKWFESQADKQFANRVTLPDTNEQISIPSVEFNVIYQLQHMFSHLFTEGFGLRHVVDYFFVLKAQKDVRCKKEDVSKTLQNLGLYKFASAMMWVMQDVLRLDSEYMIVEPNEKEGRFLLEEIMYSGNMGQHDTRLGKKTRESVVRRYFRMTRRNIRFIKHYPEEAICEPFFRTWYYFWRLMNR